MILQAQSKDIERMCVLFPPTFIALKASSLGGDDMLSSYLYELQVSRNLNPAIHMMKVSMTIKNNLALTGQVRN